MSRPTYIRGEILPPLSKSIDVAGKTSTGIASNEDLNYIATWLDDRFEIPGTGIRFGLDALIGWIPGIGDALAAFASMFIVASAWKRGAARITVLRMMLNLTIENISAQSRLSETSRTLPGKRIAVTTTYLSETSKPPAVIRGKTGYSSSVPIVSGSSRASGLSLPIASPVVTEHQESKQSRSYPHSASILRRTSATNAASLIDARLMSTFASAPAIAACASAFAVVKSDFMFGFVIPSRLVAI